MNVKRTLKKISRICIIGVVFLVFAFIWLYKIPNQSITVTIETKSGNVIRTIAAEEAMNIVDYEIAMDIENIDFIKEIRISRYFKTITIEKIQKEHVKQYVTLSAKGISFKSEMCERIQKLSRSFFLERIICSGYVVVLIFFGYVVAGLCKEIKYINNSGYHGPLKDAKGFVRNINKYHEYILYAAKTDLRAEVANSYLNWLWWILEPMGNMFVYIIVFAGFMGRSIEHYALFVYSAIIMWHFFSKSISQSVRCVRNKKEIISKIYVPKYILLITNMVTLSYKLLFSMLILVVLLIAFRVKIGIGIVGAFMAYLLMYIITYAFDIILLNYGVFIDDLSYAIGILLQMTMLLSGVFYEATTLASPVNSILIGMNPMALVIDTMRNGLLCNRIVNIPLIILWGLLGILISCIGLHIVNKNENSYVKVI